MEISRKMKLKFRLHFKKNSKHLKPSTSLPATISHACTPFLLIIIGITLSIDPNPPYPFLNLEKFLHELNL
jgi:hypothetical protein